MRYAVASVLVLICVSCTSTKSPAVTLEPVITKVVGRDEVIVVRAGAAGPTYSLESKDGEVIIPAMTLGQLAQSRPDFHRAVRTMQAGVAWAGM